MEERSRITVFILLVAQVMYYNLMEVPKPKISSPIMSGEILKILAILAPLFVNASALQISNTKPSTRDIIDINIIICW